MKLAIVFSAFIISLTSCNNTEPELYSKSLAIALPPSENKVKPVVVNSNGTTAKVVQKIIKEGNIRFETNDLNATYSQIIKNTTQSGGMIQEDAQGTDYESIYRHLVVRIPSQNFDVFINNISKGVAYFDNKEITAQDVTAQYIDIDARLKAKKSLENRYLELLKKATKVTEMLEIEKQLSAIREDIEAKQGELNYLQNQVSQSTITIDIYKKVAHENGATVSYISKIGTAISSGFNLLSGFFIWILSVWPIAVIVFIMLYLIRKKIKSKKI